MSRLPDLGRRGEGWVAIQAVLLVAVGLAGLTGPAWSGPARLVTTIAGGALVLAGGALALRGVVDLREAITPLPRPRLDARLVERGAFALVRHPIYGGLVLAATGYGLVMGAPGAVAGAVLLLLFFRLKSAREEAWLTEAYPGYAAYRSRTRRMIPYLY